MKKSIFNVLIIILLAVLTGTVIYSTFKKEKPEVITVTSKLEVRPVEIPDKMDFAGEPVPLDLFYVKEQFDRELTVNTYWHSSTLLALKRVNRWFPVIEPILKEEMVPDDFKYLALIESGLANVVSPAGAEGFWQFLDETGKAFGLTINKEVDERYHLEKATHAACRYLKKAYGKYGNWTTVAASYNAGMNRISDVTEGQLSKNYYDLYLNEETSRYVFRILAMKEIFKDPEKRGFYLQKEDLYQPIPVKQIKIESSIDDLAGFARDHGISHRMLIELNPWLRGEKLTVKKGESFIILLPD